MEPNHPEHPGQGDIRTGSITNNLDEVERNRKTTEPKLSISVRSMTMANL